MIREQPNSGSKHTITVQAGAAVSDRALVGKRRPIERIGHVWRTISRSACLALVFTAAAVDYAREIFCCRAVNPIARSARWLRRWSAIVCRVIGLKITSSGAPPAAGMLISNHLGYLDVMVLSSLVPSVFVAKREVAQWPILGLFARMAGTIFVDRSRRLKVGETNRRIAQVLGAGVVVVLFPEGTSSGGHGVLPFNASHFDPATASESPLTPAAISYELDEGSAADEVCYWRDMTLVPHLLNLLGKSSVRAVVVFGHGLRADPPVSRKQLAQQLHRSVSNLHDTLVNPLAVPSEDA